MALGFVFLITLIFYLNLLDWRILAYRLFNSAKTEAFINRKVQPWGHGVFNLMTLFLGLKVVNETPVLAYQTVPLKFVVISNHQSLLDITMIFDLFVKRQLRFVAKKELKHGLPGVSQVLRFQRHALISREGNARQTMAYLARFAKRCADKGYSPVVFPEGTRSRDGELGTFQLAGLKMICDQAPFPLAVVALDGGHRVATFLSMISPGRKTLRMKLLGFLPAPQSKDELRTSAETARSMIEQQLKKWRSTHPDA